VARFAAGVVFGLVVGVVAAAAGGLHAEDESGVGVDSVDDAQAAPEVVAEPVEPQPAYGVWDRLAQCESNGRWTANTGNSYYGGLQFDLPSWRAAGGVGLPNLASRAEQIRVGINWQRMVGWGAWPVCSRVIGVR
jgi:hypothetical protein